MSSHWHTFPQPNGAETPSIPISLGRLFQGLKHSTNSLLLGGTRQMQVIWHVPFVLFICLFFSAISKTYPEAKSNRELTPWLQACCPSTWWPCSNETSSLLFLMIIFLIFLGPCQKGHGTLRIVGVAATPLFRRASTRFSSYIFSLLSPPTSNARWLPFPESVSPRDLCPFKGSSYLTRSPSSYLYGSTRSFGFSF